MATPAIYLPQEQALPNREQNRADTLGLRTSADLARGIAERHRKGLASRRYRDLTSEKYLLHIDGEGDSQWADILYGRRVAIPRVITEYRRSENLLRPIVDNMVAYHTAMPFRFIAESRSDRR